MDNPEASQAFFNRIVNEMIDEDKAKLSGAETKDLTVQDMMNTESSEQPTMKFEPNIGMTEKLKGGFNFNPEPKK